MKKLLMVLLVLVVVIAAGVTYLYSSLDRIIEAAIEHYGSEATQTYVGVGGVKVDVVEGAGAISHLQVGNPRGFKSDYAVKLGGISIAIDPATVTTDTVVINQITVDKPSVIYELGEGGSNIDQLQKNLNSGGSSSSTEESAGPKLIIKKLIIRDGEINVSASALGGKALSTALPTIRLNNIGQKDGGATPAEIAKLVLATVMKNANVAAGKLDLGALQDGGKAIIEKSTETIKEQGVDKIKEGIGGATDKLKGLF